MGLYQWLCLLGIPTLTGLVVALVFNGVKARVKKNETESAAIQLGVQALLRSQLYHCYEYCLKKGFAALHERENFENLYVQYERLGPNGVMQDIRAKFLALPTHE